MNETLLMIIVPPALEETLVDWLLEQEQLSGFTTADVYGHGSRTTGMSLLEQVSGRQRRIQFTLHADHALIEALVEQLKSRFAGTGLHYMVQPLTAAGKI